MNTNESNLVAHARHELTRAGLFDDDSDYDGMLGDATMEIIRLFAAQGHSGMSAALVIDLASRLMRYEPLSPLTAAPDEWMHVGEEMGGNNVWQNRRDSAAFSRDGGKTYKRNGEDVQRTSDPA